MRARISEFDEAIETIGHDRVSEYGDPVKSFRRIALMWSAITGVDVSPQQVAHMMIALKVSRLQTSPDHFDSLVDIVGYARCAVLCGSREASDSANPGI